MQTETLTVLLDYICNDLLVALVMSLIGSILRELFNSINNTNGINIKKIILSTIFSSFLVSALSDWIKNETSTAVYIFCCLMSGVWGFTLFSMANNAKVMLVFLKHLLKNVTTPIGEATKDAADELGKINDTDEAKKKSTKKRGTTTRKNDSTDSSKCNER